MNRGKKQDRTRAFSHIILMLMWSVLRAFNKLALGLDGDLFYPLTIQQNGPSKAHFNKAD